MSIPDAALRPVRDRASLFAFLREQLKWPVDPEDTFTYAGPALPSSVAQRAEVTRIVPFGANDPWAIMLVEFSTEFRRSDLREILRGIRAEVRSRSAYEGRQPEAFVFVCATQNPKGYRFAHFQERPSKQPKLSVFGWDIADRQGTRTLRDENLPALVMPPADLFGGHDWTRAYWNDAWNVEKVTGEFYKSYRKVFEAFLPRVKGIIEEQERWDFAQQLFSRIMFCWFLQKKRWLNDRPDYIRDLWQNAVDHASTRPKGPCASFYTNLLRPLFFEVLNVPQSERPSDEEHERLMDLLGRVPYLNGGLFDPRTTWDRSDAVSIANDAFEPLFDLFEDYRFTIDESTPDDIEVAVDPEMLGRVFEELVTGRHESGSYYTPRPIVAFMCREALKGYLADACPGENESVVAPWVDGDDDASVRLTNPEAVFDALKQVRVCDPACGSGAYLLGMMQELLRLRQSLFRASVRDHKLIRYRKLEIIERNLYGVDIAQFAVNTARLRLWLSLVVDDERHPLDEPDASVALPNLDFRIERGDSLTAPDPQISDGSDLFREKDIEHFERLKEQYTDPAYGGDKCPLLAEIDKVRERIARAEHGGRPVPDGAFDWRVEFAEVWAPRHASADLGGNLNLGGTLAATPLPGGFDIVLANPPYVRQELIREQKPLLRQVYSDFYCGTADLYCYFYARGLQLLRPDGMFVYISSNKWFRAAYGEKLRRLVADTCDVQSIIDFGELPVFNAATFPMIFISRKGASDGSPTFTQIGSLEPPYPDVRTLIQESGRPLSAGALTASTWRLNASGGSGLDANLGPPLCARLGSHFVRGLTTGYNEAFVISDAKRNELCAADPRSAEIIKRYVAGRNVRRWSLGGGRDWIIVTPVGVPIRRYAAVFAHLRQWRDQLAIRQDKGDHWWELRPCTYYGQFEKPKIVTTKIARRPAFAYDSGGHYLGNTSYFMTVDPAEAPYIVAILNSSSVLEHLRETCVSLGDAGIHGRVEPRPKDLEAIPIPTANATDQAAIAALAQKCIDAGGVDCVEWEREIDERVAALYGL